jgi:hypothetical protein
MQRVTEHGDQVDMIPVVRAVPTTTRNASKCSRPGRGSWVVPVLVLGGGLMVIAAGLAVVFLLLFLPRMTRGTEIPIGKTSQLYYKSTVSRDEAQKLAAHLDATLFNHLENHATVQVNRDGNTYQLRFVTKPGVQPTEFEVLLLQAYGAQVSREVFGGAPVEVHLCDQSLETIRVLPPLKK